MIPTFVRRTEKSISDVPIIDESLKNYFSAFPKEGFLQQQFKSGFVINRPMSGVGGDGYWVHSDINNKFLVVFDCMGHGRLASMMTRIYLNAIKSAIVDKGIIDPARILIDIHKSIEDRFRHKTNKLVGTGADMGIIRLDEKNNRLHYAGAKMDLVSILDGEIQRIKADKRQLGELFEFPHDYSTIQIELSEFLNSSFYLFSDGVADLIGGPNDKKLKYSNLKDILLKGHCLTMEEQKNLLEKSFADWAGINLPPDDLLMIGISV